MPDQLWALYPYLHLAGRVLFSSFVILFGLQQLLRPGEIVEYFRRKGIPGPRPVAFATGLMQAAGGTMVLTGWSRFVGAGLIFLVLFPSAFALHAFWHETDAEARLSERAQFFMTLGLAGAALFVAYYGHDVWPATLAN